MKRDELIEQLRQCPNNDEVVFTITEWDGYAAAESKRLGHGTVQYSQEPSFIVINVTRLGRNR